MSGSPQRERQVAILSTSIFRRDSLRFVGQLPLENSVCLAPEGLIHRRILVQGRTLLTVVEEAQEYDPHGTSDGLACIGIWECIGMTEDGS